MSTPTLPADQSTETAESADSNEPISARLLSSVTNKAWKTVQLSPDDSLFPRLERSIVDILQCQNLIVLCGLGTSLCVKGSDDRPLSPTMAILWGEAAAMPEFAGVPEKVTYPAGLNDIELLLSYCQLSEIFRPDPAVRQFIQKTEALIVRRCRFVTPTLNLPCHQSFLLKAARRSTRLPRMKLFTTNYDLCFEAAASSARFVVVDGFSHTQPQEFDGSHFDYDLVRRAPDRETPDYIPNVFHLYKMHGSVDWALSEREAQIRREASPAEPHLIYPRHTKYQSSYDQPFLEMMSRLQIALRQPNTGLLIIGFGFNDFHITQPLMAAVDSNASLKCMIVAPNLETQAANNESVARLSALVKQGDLRISMLSSTFEDFVPIVPDLVAKTEDEEHRTRIKIASTRSS